jgi:hypothetical protein
MVDGEDVAALCEPEGSGETWQLQAAPERFEHKFAMTIALAAASFFVGCVVGWVIARAYYRRSAMTVKCPSCGAVGEYQGGICAACGYEIP